HAIPAMKRASGGAIVNVSSISALRPRGLTVYSVSKGAVIALTRAMAVDHGPDGIRVNCVAPGPVYTPMVYQKGMSAAARDQRRKASVLGIEGTGWDIGHAVRFLLSDLARYPVVASAVMAEYPPAIGGQTKTPRELDLARRVFRISKHCTDDGQNEISMPESGRAVNRIPSRRQPNRATIVRTWCSLSTAVTPAVARSKPPPC